LIGKSCRVRILGNVNNPALRPALRAYRKNPRVTLQFAVIGINAGRYFPQPCLRKHVLRSPHLAGNLAGSNIDKTSGVHLV